MTTPRPLTRRPPPTAPRSRTGPAASPPLVLVHGSVSDHNRFATLLPHLTPHAKVHALDRRGRGGSGDSAEYALEREVDDVVAVLAAVAENAGLLLQGELSPSMFHDATARLDATLPHSRVHVLPGQSHVADQREPEAFARLLLDFLRAEPGA